MTSQTSIKTIESSSPSYSNETKHGHVMLYNEDTLFSNKWVTFQEPIGAWGNNSFTAQGIFEHLNVTKDISDYLWYSTRYITNRAFLYSMRACLCGILELYSRICLTGEIKVWSVMICSCTFEVCNFFSCFVILVMR